MNQKNIRRREISCVPCLKKVPGRSKGWRHPLVDGKAAERIGRVVGMVERKG